ncbi:hypothetical protein JZ751_007708 [Albula glossodonta]|uniref:Serine/threonine-protein phosphatase 2A 55 kDa regulatory subunit B n=1 Tax=Albula glossodonta TaxID=121402 RepID=A0A8T2MPM7_9TELE|nr:hypothetical protein JZ751_007708 [Albula glossodonta]
MGEDADTKNINNSFLPDYVTEADVISTVEFSHRGDLLATGDKGGRVSHEPDFDYLKSLEIEEKINKIRWIPQHNAARFLLSTNGECVGKDQSGSALCAQVPVLKPTDLMVEVSPRRIFANGHTYHVNSISVNSDCETYLSADDLRINLWHLDITDRCFMFEEPEDPGNRSFFSEIVSSISDVRFSHSGRYLLTRDYLTVKVWDLNMERGPIETYQVHDYLRSKLCSLYENDCIFDKFECSWNGTDSVIMTGAYNNFFRMFDRETGRGVTLEAARETGKAHAVLRTRRVRAGGKRRKDQVTVDSLDFTKKILHMAWHPTDNIIAIAATNNLYIFQDKVSYDIQ